MEGGASEDGLPFDGHRLTCVIPSAVISITSGFSPAAKRMKSSSMRLSVLAPKTKNFFSVRFAIVVMSSMNDPNASVTPTSPNTCGKVKHPASKRAAWKSSSKSSVAT